MAFQKVQTESSESSGKSRYAKIGKFFQKVGDKFYGVFVSAEEGKFGLDVTFRADVGEVVLTVNRKLREQIEEADPQEGNCLLLELTKLTYIEKFGKTGRTIEVSIDPEFEGKPPKNGANIVLDDRK